MKAAELLSQYYITEQEASDWIELNVSNPSLIYNTARQYGIDSSMLAEIVTSWVPGVNASLVEGFFNSQGLDGTALRASSSAISDYVFLTDLNDGDIFLYNPVEQSGKKIYSFNKTITDIAVDETGNIYVSDFNTIYKYTLSSGTLSPLVSDSGSFNSLAINGSTLYAASTNNDSLLAYDTVSGALISQTNIGGGGSAGDITFIGADLFRTTLENGLLKHDLIKNQTLLLTQTLDAYYWGLAATPDATLRAFRSDGTVTEVDPENGQTISLPMVSLTGLNQLSGAAEALETHVALFL